MIKESCPSSLGRLKQWMMKLQKLQLKLVTSCLNLLLTRLRAQAQPAPSTTPQRAESLMAYRYRAPQKLVSYPMGLRASVSRVEAQPEAYGRALNLDHQSNREKMAGLDGLINFQLILVDLVKVAEDGLSIQPFAHFSLN